jgi:hypothetical protein
MNYDIFYKELLLNLKIYLSLLNDSSKEYKENYEKYETEINNYLERITINYDCSKNMSTPGKPPTASLSTTPSARTAESSARTLSVITSDKQLVTTKASRFKNVGKTLLQIPEYKKKIVASTPTTSGTLLGPPPLPPFVTVSPTSGTLLGPPPLPPFVTVSPTSGTLLGPPPLPPFVTVSPTSGTLLGPPPPIPETPLGPPSAPGPPSAAKHMTVGNGRSPQSNSTDNRKNLLSQIQANPHLKKSTSIVPVTRPQGTGPSGRGNLLSEIKTGKKLKKTETKIETSGKTEEAYENVKKTYENAKKTYDSAKINYEKTNNEEIRKQINDTIIENRKLEINYYTNLLKSNDNTQNKTTLGLLKRNSASHSNGPSYFITVEKPDDEWVDRKYLKLSNKQYEQKYIKYKAKYLQLKKSM